MAEDYPLYHITHWGVNQIPIYNCNFCQYDSTEMDKITEHVDQDHPYDERGNRMNLRGEQYSNFDGSPFLKNLAKDEEPMVHPTAPVTKSVKDKE